MINRDEFKNQNRKNFGMKISAVEVEEDLRPSILLIGINAPSFTAKGMLNGIVQNGYRAEFSDWQKIRMEEGNDGLRDRVLVKAKMTSPELIICNIQNPEAMAASTFAELETIAPVVNLTVDCRANIDWLLEVAPLISLTCFSNSDDVATCEKKGIRNTVSLHSSCNYDFYKPREFSFPLIGGPNITQPQPRMYALPEIVFIGQNYEHTNASFPLAKQRQEMVEYLYHTYPDQFAAFGMGQRNSRYVNEYEELSLYHDAKIVIGHNNFLRENYSSDRMFRAMGSGAFYLGAYFPGLEKMFKKEIEIEWWESFQELKNMIDYYLAFPKERIEVAAAGCKKVRSEHRWADRIKIIIDSLRVKQ